MLKRVRARRTTWLAERLRGLDDDELEALERAIGPLGKLLWRQRALLRAERAHLRQPQTAPQLPPLLHRPGRLRQRHVDAERRARLAHRRADAARRSRSALLAFCRFIPFTVFGLFSGVVADRIDNRQARDRRRRASRWSSRRARGARRSRARRRSGSSTCSPRSPAPRSSSTRPGRHALTFQMVGRDELPNAVALNASLFNASRVVGPAFAGVLIAAFGVGVCFAINTVTLPRRARRAADDAARRSSSRWTPASGRRR